MLDYLRPRLLAVALFALLGAVAVSFTVAAPSGNAARSARTLRVATAKNARLGKWILVTNKGLALYTLSSESRRRIVCASAGCLQAWPPLLLRRGVTPTGVRSLSMIRRPDGRLQVAYRGKPLYRYVGDRKKGDANGDKYSDAAGTWNVAVAPRTRGGSGQTLPAGENPPAGDPTPPAYY